MHIREGITEGLHVICYQTIRGRTDADADANTDPDFNANPDSLAYPN